MEKNDGLCFRNIFFTYDEVASSLLLQMAVYFNICFTPFWVISHILTFNLKYDALNEIYQIVLSVVFFIIFLVEGPRLYLGYAGNLSESVSNRHLKEN
ncbi:transmembrane protein 17B-like [Centruroides sculpturatus]|uniref:transmembrane protein 17B-like n=1 Tax=Centruroides sculpturatus TaxID=218467 RepID=UPI000C6E6B61|nr:transmembrane protein 17B-like [Centruroides sculpturatus]